MCVLAMYRAGLDDSVTIILSGLEKLWSINLLAMFVLIRLFALGAVSEMTWKEV